MVPQVGKLRVGLPMGTEPTCSSKETEEVYKKMKLALTIYVEEEGTYGATHNYRQVNAKYVTAQKGEEINSKRLMIVLIVW